MATLGKKRKLPKAPKLTASKEVWDNYEKKGMEVKKHNDAVEKEKDRRAKIKSKVRS